MTHASSRRVLIARLDSAGDVLLAGPAVRGVADTGSSVTLMCSHRGQPMASLLPGVAATLAFDAPWILADSPPVRPDDLLQAMVDVRSGHFDEAIILTSFHQSPLPLALLLRMVGVPRISAVSEDYPGGLLDVRIQLPEGLHEAQRAAAIVTAAGYPTSDASLALIADLPDSSRFAGSEEPFVVVHPGADAPARAIPADLAEEVVRRLADRGWRVLVTGGPDERLLTAQVAGSRGLDLGGRTSWGELADLIRRAAAVVVGNTGPAHLAAAAATPVVSLWAPVVPSYRWRPFGVPCRLLGDEAAPCRDTRARVCSLPEHPCLARVSAADVTRAVESLTAVVPA